MLYLVGLGLGDEKDITVRGLEAVKSCDKIFLEAYTSILGEAFYGKKITIADRELVESGSEDIIEGAVNGNVALLVVGDPFGATTHTDFVLRCKEKNIPIEVIHNASIMNAAGACGGRLVYEPPRYMTVNQAAEQLIAVEEKYGRGAIPLDELCIGLSRVGQKDQIIIAAPLQELLTIDFGEPLHSLIIPGESHFLEKEFLEYLKFTNETKRIEFVNSESESDDEGVKLPGY